jgi:hypothetical protein
MSFKNLEERFNANVNKLYAGATTKFNNGRPSNNRDDDPLIVRRPGEGYFGKFESRMLPINSTREDVKRLTLFQINPRGIQFLAKQQLLQTGNTFQLTRLINPAFVIGNAVPFLHIKRNLRPLSDLIGKPDTSYENVRKLGQLQVESYNKLKSKPHPQFVTNYLSQKAFGRNTSGTTRTSLLGGLTNVITNLISSLTSPLSALNPLQVRNIGERTGWNASRPELNSIVNSVSTANTFYQNDYQEFLKTIEPNNNFGGIPYIKYFQSSDGLKTSKVSSANDGPATSVVTRNPNDSRQKRLSYVKDPSNDRIQSNNVSSPYNFLNNSQEVGKGGWEDPVNVSFAMGLQTSPVRFRAFIKDLQQTATPEYKAYQYVGRMEKFVNYVGVQREISFKLSVIAFSRDELDGVWTRINYLTGLVYPYGFNRGIFQPNIVKLTIGNVYVNQPGYVTSLDTNFNDITESWELDNGKQVPIGATMTMRFVLIEKQSRIADSPFYGITEKLTPGFNETIPIPKPPQSDNRTQPPGTQPIASLIDRFRPPTFGSRANFGITSRG